MNDTNRTSTSKMAEGVAIHRIVESGKPEDVRIFYDPYAIHFVSQKSLELFKDPVKAKSAREYYESLFPGIRNSIIARIRYFDDLIRKSIDEGLEQLVILGAGYDTRAYRIEGLQKGKIKVFEIDHPGTQNFKIQKIRQLFGSIPQNVVHVPIDFEIEALAQKLFESGYDPSKKTLFVMEGLIMYIPPNAVDETLSFMVENSRAGSALIFDYYPQSVVDGTCKLEAGRNIRNYVIKLGEPFQFGIAEGTVESFLRDRGFSKIQNVTSEDYKKAYFHGKNKDREVFSLLYFVHALID